MRSLLLAVVLIGLGLILLGSGCNSYNTLVDADENVSNAWSKVESEYQRRADLIPNLVNTVKGVADFEKSTLTEVTNARARATSINIDPSNMSEADLQKFQEAQSGLSQSLGRLLLVAENYPQLKANENFQHLQTRISSLESAIADRREFYNESVNINNTRIEQFPDIIIARLLNFGSRDLLEFSEQEKKDVDLKNLFAE